MIKGSRVWVGVTDVETYLDYKFIDGTSVKIKKHDEELSSDEEDVLFIKWGKREPNGGLPGDLIIGREERVEITREMTFNDLASTHWSFPTGNIRAICQKENPYCHEGLMLLFFFCLNKQYSFLNKNSILVLTISINNLRYNMSEN